MVLNPPLLNHIPFKDIAFSKYVFMELNAINCMWYLMWCFKHFNIKIRLHRKSYLRFESSYSDLFGEQIKAS